MLFTISYFIKKIFKNAVFNDFGKVEKFATFFSFWLPHPVVQNFLIV
jgi:hypothetical protein